MAEARRPRRLAVVVLTVGLLIVVYPFGHAITEGSYFGECDHAIGTECRIVHVLGVVMHADVPLGEETRPATEGASQLEATIRQKVGRAEAIAKFEVADPFDYRPALQKERETDEEEAQTARAELAGPR